MTPRQVAYAVLAAIALFVASGCANKYADDLQSRQTAIQDCLVRGGVPELGVGHTIVCR